jgi:hypothetical protein
VYEYLHPIVTLTRCPSGGHRTTSVPGAMTGFGHGIVCTHEICASRTVTHTPIRGVEKQRAIFWLMM